MKIHRNFITIIIIILRQKNYLYSSNSTVGVGPGSLDKNKVPEF